MRAWIGLTLLLASCAIPPNPSPPPVAAASVVPGTFLDQGWSASDRATFVGTAQGSHLMPLPWFAALRRVDRDEPFAADQLARYGYLPSAPAASGAAPLPIGFVRDGAPNDPQLGMTCAACHTGELRYKGRAWRVDGGRADADFQTFLTELGAAARLTASDDARFVAFAAAVLGPNPAQPQAARLRADLATWSRNWDGFMAASLPAHEWGPGRLDALGMIFNRVLALDLRIPANFHTADAPVRYPFIWDAPRQDWTQWPGAAPNGTYLRGMARNTGEVFGVFGIFDPVRLPFGLVRYDNQVNLSGLQTLEQEVVKLRAPAWPSDVFPLDPARVQRGAQLFQAECATCHAARPSRVVAKAWDTPRCDVGTDRRAFDNAQLGAASGVLEGTQQPPIIGERLGPTAGRLSILANAVTGTLVLALATQEAPHRAIQRDLNEGRLPLVRPGPAIPHPPECNATSPSPGAAASASAAAKIASATKDLYKGTVGAPGAAYEARVLTGIWAVGPYLHNGSVATLWELLKPARERMTRFAVGHREFDPVKVGLETDAAPGRRIFVVDETVGNGNGGHEYGTTLPEADRWALVEYLKTVH